MGSSPKHGFGWVQVPSSFLSSFPHPPDSLLGLLFFLFSFKEFLLSGFLSYSVNPHHALMSSESSAPHPSNYSPGTAKTKLISAHCLFSQCHHKQIGFCFRSCWNEPGWLKQREGIYWKDEATHWLEGKAQNPGSEVTEVGAAMGSWTVGSGEWLLQGTKTRECRIGMLPTMLPRAKWGGEGWIGSLRWADTCY